MPRLLLATLAAALALVPAAQAQTKIQPGAKLLTDAGQCTLNFIYDGVDANAGRTFIGTAAHCGDRVGQEAQDGDGEAIGRFAFIGDPDDAAHDYAFIEVALEHLGRVDPAVKGHPEYPKGFTVPEETSAGDLIQMSGYGLGFGETQFTQENRQTVLQSDDADVFTLSGPSVNGDSGGPFVHIDTGKALGLVSQYGLDRAATDVGPTIAGVLAKAAKAGFPVALRAAGQPAPSVETAPEPAPPGPEQPPAGEPSEPESEPKKAKKSKRGKKAKRQKACRKKARKIKNKRKRRAAVRRCAKRR